MTENSPYNCAEYKLIRDLSHESAGVAQWLERHLAKVDVVSSNLITRCE